MTKNIAVVLAVGLMVIAAITGWALIQTVRDITAGPAAITGGVATQVEHLLHPTQVNYPHALSEIVEVS
jgi:hypothetical protein